MGYVYYSQAFNEQLKQYCSNEFISINLQELQVLPQNTTNHVNLIDVSNWLIEGDTLRKVKFCLAWLQAVTANVTHPQYGIVLIDGIGFTSMRFTDFLCYLTEHGIVTREQHMLLSQEWLDITYGLPYYDVD